MRGFPAGEPLPRLDHYRWHAASAEHDRADEPRGAAAGNDDICLWLLCLLQRCVHGIEWRHRPLRPAIASQAPDFPSKVRPGLRRSGRRGRQQVLKAAVETGRDCFHIGNTMFKVTEKTEKDRKRHGKRHRGRHRAAKKQQRERTSTYPGPSAGLQGWVPLPLHTVRCRLGQSR